jgi:hypothetical protein
VRALIPNQVDNFGFDHKQSSDNGVQIIKAGSGKA